MNQLLLRLAENLILSSIVTLSASASFAAPPVMEISPVVTDGKPRLGVQYAAGFFALTATLRTADVSGSSGARVYAELVDLDTTNLVSTAQPLAPVRPGSPAGSRPT